MEYSRFSKSKVGRCKKNLIPWHCQKRYLESLHQISLNNTMSKAVYKHTISKLQANNKILALALQQSRCIRPEKDELVVDNGKLMDIINFSKLKLTDMSASMKKATSCLDETLLMLNSCISNILSKPTQNNINYRNDFKSKIQEINIERIDESMEIISENASSLNEEAPEKIKSKGSKLSGRRYPSTDNRKRKSDVRQNCKTSTKISKATDSTSTKSLSVINPQSTDLKNSLKLDSVGKRKRTPSRKICDVQSSSSFTQSSTSSETSYEEKGSVEKPHEKNKKNVLDAINSICETLIDQRVQMSQAMVVCEQESSAAANEIVEQSNMPSKDTRLKIKPSDKIIREIESLPCFSSPNDVLTKDNNEMQSCPEDKNDQTCILNHKKDFPPLCTITPCETSQKKIDDDGVNLSNTLPNITLQACSKDNFAHSSKNNTAKDFKSPGTTASKNKNKVHFYIENENAIEKWSSPKSDLKRSRKKNKVKNVYSNLKNNASPRKRALQPISVLLNNKKMIGENRFLVTAEVHQPPDGSCGESSSCQSYVEKMQPSVVLTDIFKSYKNDISATVGGCLLKNEYLGKESSAKFPEILRDAASENDLNANFFDSNSDSENKILPRKSMLEERKEQRRRRKVVSYKEPNLMVKMRRCL